MEELLNRLAKVDPANFRIIGGVPCLPEYDGSELWHPVGEWEVAGWCLEKMQAEWHRLSVLEGGAPVGPIYEAIAPAVEEIGLVLTPEKILTAYCDMVEARG